MDRLGVGHEALREDQSCARLLRDLRLRPDRPDARRARVRPDHPGARGRHERHRRRALRADARRLSGRRHDRRAHRGVRDRVGARAPRERRRGRVHRRVDARLHARHDGLGRVELPDRRPGAGADGQRQFHRGAVGRVRDRRRSDQHRREQAGTVRGALPRPSAARTGIADPRFAHRESRKRNRAELNARLERALADRRPRRNGRRSSTASAFPPAASCRCPKRSPVHRSPSAAC